MTKRQRGLHAYVQLQVYNVVFNEWVRIAVAPVLFSTGGFVILLLYIPLRYSQGIPGFMSAGFTYLALAMLAVVLCGLTDVLGATRNSESVIRSLQSKRISSIGHVQLSEHPELLKRAKVLRPVAIPIGSFGNVTLSAPVAFLEEILNQLLFLLSL